MSLYSPQYSPQCQSLPNPTETSVYSPAESTHNDPAQFQPHLGHSCPVCLLFSQCCGYGCWEFVLPLSCFPSPGLFIWYPMLTLVPYVCVKCSCPHSPASTWGLRHRQEITNYVHGSWSDNVYTVKVSGLGLFCIWPHQYCRMFDT